MKNVLVLDSSLRDLQRVRRLLETAGYRTTGARDEETARAVLAYAPPDLMVIDKRAICQNGLIDIAALKRVMSAARTARVLLITDTAATADVFEGWQLGVDAYLCRPYDRTELVEFVRRVLETAEAPDQRTVGNSAT